VTDTQLALGWDSGRARHDSPATSVEAAAKVDVPRRCAETLAALDAPTTAAELALVLQGRGYRWAQPNVVSRRLTDLERRALVRRCGERMGPYGRNVTVWEAA
jgi:hypothetical protein